MVYGRFGLSSLGSLGGGGCIRPGLYTTTPIDEMRAVHGSRYWSFSWLFVRIYRGARRTGLWIDIPSSKSSLLETPRLNHSHNQDTHSVQDEAYR